MLRVYTAASLPEAYLVLHLLKRNDIDAHVFNENAQGAVGELPANHGWPEIWIEDEANREAAARVVAAFERSDAHADAITCARCQEENPGSFEICWSCGSAL